MTDREYEDCLIEEHGLAAMTIDELEYFVSENIKGHHSDVYLWIVQVRLLREIRDRGGVPYPYSEKIKELEYWILKQREELRNW